MMKLRMGTFTLVVLLAGGAVSKEEKVTTATVAASRGTTRTTLVAKDSSAAVALIPITGMSCSACIARARKALQNIDGVDEVTVSLAEREAEVRYHPAKVTPERLVQTINDLGYKAGSPTVSEKK